MSHSLDEALLIKIWTCREKQYVILGHTEAGKFCVQATTWPTLLLSKLQCLMNYTNSHDSMHELVATCHLWSSVHLVLFLVPLALLNTSPLDNGTVNLTGLTFSYSLHR